MAMWILKGLSLAGIVLTLILLILKKKKAGIADVAEEPAADTPTDES